MKKIYIFVIAALLSSCITVDNHVGNPPKPIKQFLKRIIENPELALDLKKNFPEYINDTLCDDLMYNQFRINNFIRVSKKYFDDPMYAEYFSCFSAREDKYIITDSDWNSKICFFNKEDIFSTQLVKGMGLGIGFTWIRIDSTYYLYDFFGSGK